MPHDIQYDIRYVEKTTVPCLSIKLKSRLNNMGEFIIRFPIGSQNIHLGQLPTSLTVESTQDSYVSKLKGKPEEDFEINYQFCSNNSYHLIEWPIIEEQFFLFRPVKVLASPENTLNDNWIIRINMDSMPKEFNIISSQSSNARNLVLKEPFAKFKNTVIVGGSGSDIKFNQIKVNTKPITIITRGEFKSLTENPISYFKKLISQQRAFWKDNDFPHYLIVVQELSCEGIHTGFEGRHYQDAFIMQISHCRYNEAFEREMKWCISHELLHAWMGYKIKIDEAHHRSLLWFVEGFNDYYGLLFALKTGLISYSEYIDQYNDFLKYYFLLPINQISNEDIIHNVDKDSQYRILAQLRGHFVAQSLSKKLKKANLSLETLMLKIKNHQGKKPYRELDVHNLFKDYMGDSLWKDILTVIEQGNLISLTDDTLGKSMTLVKKEINVPDFEFDLQSLLKTHTICKLKIDSPAYKSGLRENQKIQFHNINLIKTQKNVTLGFTENGVYKELTFVPNTTKKMIPQYILVDNVHIPSATFSLLKH